MSAITQYLAKQYHIENVNPNVDIKLNIALSPAIAHPEIFESTVYEDGNGLQYLTRFYLAFSIIYLIVIQKYLYSQSKEFENGLYFKMT